MLVIYPFSIPDQEQALKNAKWIAELGDYKQHDIFILSDRRCDMDTVKETAKTLTSVFKIIQHRWTKTDIDGWPEGANHMFGYATALIQHTKEWPCFLWLEPDAIPLCPGWLDKLEQEYKRAGKPFMGDRVQVEDIPVHMSGVGIYQNPIYLLAGEAYRAHDTAWDMAAKDQIVPNAHFTDLIEHAWKHPKFTSIDELHTQIAPETILFHSSKDGSLIDLLRQKAAPETKFSVPTEPTSVLKTSREEIGTRAAQPTYDIFIRTYPGDYAWLLFCIRSIRRFVTGFRKIWIISPQPPGDLFKLNYPDIEWSDIEWKVMNDETEDGYLAQQITKLYADVITDYQADYILHVDSDTLFARSVSPQDFFEDGKPTWYYTPYEAIETPWKPITEKFIRQPVAYEFMRRMPFLIPTWLYPKMREYCHAAHGVIISDYIRIQPQRAFSEFNAIGAYAFRNHGASFKWINTLERLPEHFCRQFRSWEGITPENKAEIQTILSGGRDAGEVSNNESGVKKSEIGTDQRTNPPPAQIKVLPNDIWVLEGDQISQWVEQEGRLDHDQNLLPDILKHIKPGDTVVDAGAFIGDHTVAYANAVGSEGLVHAFEPNPTAYKCLSHNLESCNNVILHGYGLSDTMENVPLSGNNGNWGGVYVGEHMQLADVRVRALETEVPWRINFIKIDVEGYELKVLRGAGNLINRCRPKMVIEINSEALARQGTTTNEIFGWITQHNYDWTIIQKNCSMSDPLYDILCLPTQPPEISKSDSLAHTSESSPVATFNYGQMIAAVNVIKQFASQNTSNRLKAMVNLRYAGLTPNKKQKKKSGKSKTKKSPW